jgi:hypothetical protein
MPTPISPALPSGFPAGSLPNQSVYALQKSFAPMRRWMMEPIALMQQHVYQTYDAYKPLWDQALGEVPDGLKRKETFLQEILNPHSSMVQKIPPALAPLVAQLKANWQGVMAEKSRREQVVIQHISGWLPWLHQMVEPFRQSVLASRPEPSRMRDPHPANVRIVGAVSQNYGATGAHGLRFPGDLTLGNKAWLQAVRSTASLEEAIERYQQWSVIPAEADPNLPDTGLQIVSPVSTRRSFPHAWRKVDNANPDIKRFAVFIDDGVHNMTSQTATMQQSLVYQDTAAPAAAHGYRVDAIRLVRPPSAEEAARGITIHQKLQQVFGEMQAFAAQQKAQAQSRGQDPNQLRFESLITWNVHGTAELPPDHQQWETMTGQPSPLRFQEGAMEFKALFTPAFPESPDTVSEAEIKHLERTYLGDYTAVIQQLSSCLSGALTA